MRARNQFAPGDWSDSEAIEVKVDTLELPQTGGSKNISMCAVYVVTVLHMFALRQQQR